MALVFNGIERLIEVTDPGIFALDAGKEIYSAWKRWLQLDPANGGYAPAFRTFGGDPTAAGQFAPKYYFLQNYWRVYINNGNVVSIAINLYTDDYITPYLVATGSGVSDRNSDAVNVNDDNIKNQSFLEAKVFINKLGLGKPGIVYPLGTPTDPSDNYVDAKIIASVRNYNKFDLEGILVLNGGETVNNTGWFGSSPITSVLVFAGHDATDTTIDRIGVTGTMNPTGRCSIYQSAIGNLVGFTGIAIQCALNGNVTLNNTVTERTVFDFCSSAIGGNSKPEVNVNGTAQEVVFRHYSGGLKITNSTHTDCKISVDGQGRLEIDSSCTEGEMVVGGTWEITDNSGPNFTVLKGAVDIERINEDIAWSEKASDNAEQANLKL